MSMNIKSTEQLRMQELVVLLNQAGKVYYAENRELMSNRDYDGLYDELKELEERMGVILSNSPTQHVGYEAVSDLPKERHESPMLSLEKTKSPEMLQEWLQGKEGLLSWKLDGLTVVLTYQNGELVKAVTRGSGEVGEVITNNARVFQNIPLRIPHKQEVILRGEAVIKYSDFQLLNDAIDETEAKYKNPRNLCSGSVRQLNNEITAQRNVNFFAFALVKTEGVIFEDSREMQMQFLKDQGFSLVEYVRVKEDNIIQELSKFEEQIATFDIPTDGLVLTLDDIAYGESLGRTAKFPRDSIAFKWADEVSETKLVEVVWSPSRTGLINPIAVFEPVELEGTTVSRASLHNVSIIRNLKLGIGDRITVYKANMIIPQVAENLTQSDDLEIPITCPVCGEKTQISQISDVQVLYCSNEYCVAKKIKAFTHFVSRDAMNMDGLSEATLEKFIEKGFLHNFCDIFHLSQYEKEIIELDGFGEKSYQNLLHSIEVARKTTLPRLIFSLGIANIGLANAKMICKEFQFSPDKLLQATREELNDIDGVGEVIAQTFLEYFHKEENNTLFANLLKEVEIENVIMEEAGDLTKQVFVITGSLFQFENRTAMKDEIEKRGGKVTGSVTKNTNCLINNDTTSNSSKNKKAKELGVPILSEADFIQEFLTNTGDNQGGSEDAN